MNDPNYVDNILDMSGKMNKEIELTKAQLSSRKKTVECRIKI